MNIISLFAGAGGLDLGFEKAGFNIVWANEFDKKITATYKHNHKNTILCPKSIVNVANDEIPNTDIDGIIGGPPCQSWSLAGNMKGKLDKRGALVDEYIRIVKHVQPKFFVFENVKGIVSSAHIDSFKAILQALQELGYDTKYQLLNAVDYNTAQTRERIFIVGFKKSLNVSYDFPSPSPNKLAIKDILNDLPEQKPFDKDTSQFDSNEYFVGSFPSIFMSRNRIRNAVQPSFTIQASGRQAPLHFSSPEMIKVGKDKFEFNGNLNQVRRLSVRECARIQGFPDDFKFIYHQINDAYKMIGNAVPVPLANALANSIHDCL